MPTSSSPGIGGGNGGTYGDMQDGEFRPFIRRLPEFHFWCVWRCSGEVTRELIVVV